MTYELIRPFGPLILKSKLPDEMVKKINEYVELEENKDKKFPNLLSRDICNTYLNELFAKKIGFVNFVENLGNQYLKSRLYTGGEVFLESIHGSSYNECKEVYTDAWVNRYFAGDFTPVHKHSSFISGVAILKISTDLIKEQNYKDEKLREEESLNGNLQFIMNSSDCLCDNLWNAPQEIGAVFIFPGWLMHHTYPFKNKKERRTISFNLSLGEY